MSHKISSRWNFEALLKAYGIKTVIPMGVAKSDSAKLRESNKSATPSFENSSVATVKPSTEIALALSQRENKNTNSVKSPMK